MARIASRGAVVALVAAVLAVFGGAIGITTLWPVLLAVGVGLAIAPITAGRVAAFALGSVVSWGVMALDAGLLPDAALSRVLTVVIGIVIVTVIALVTVDRAPLWAGLAGFAAFAALYEPMYAANPTAFLTESPVALTTVLLAAAVGALTVALTDLLTAGSTREDQPEPVLVSEAGAA